MPSVAEFFPHNDSLRANMASLPFDIGMRKIKSFRRFSSHFGYSLEEEHSLIRATGDLLVKRDFDKIAEEYNKALDKTLEEKNKLAAKKEKALFVNQMLAITALKDNELAVDALCACSTGDLAAVQAAYENGAQTWNLVCNVGGLLLAMDAKQAAVFEFILNRSDNYHVDLNFCARLYAVIFKLDSASPAVKQMQDMMVERILKDIAKVSPKQDIRWALLAMHAKPELINTPIAEQHGISPAMFLVAAGRLDSLVWLDAEHAIDFAQKDDNGLDLYGYALHFGHKNILDWLISKMHIELHPFLVACRDADVLSLNAILDSYDGSLDDYVESALYLAVIYKFYQGVISIISTLETSIEDAHSPLFVIATMQQDRKMMRILSDAGASVTACKGAALSSVIANKHEGLIEALLQNDAMYAYATGELQRFDSELKQAGLNKTLAQFRFGNYGTGVDDNLAALEGLSQLAALDGLKSLLSDDASVVNPFKRAFESIAQQFASADNYPIRKGFPRFAKLHAAAIHKQWLKDCELPISALERHIVDKLPSWLQQALSEELGRLVISYELVDILNSLGFSYKFYIYYHFEYGLESTLVGELLVDNVYSLDKRAVVRELYTEATWPLASSATMNKLFIIAQQLKAYIGFQDLNNFRYKACDFLVNPKLKSDIVQDNLDNMRTEQLVYATDTHFVPVVDTVPIAAAMFSAAAALSPQAYTAKLRAEMEAGLKAHEELWDKILYEQRHEIETLFNEAERTVDTNLSELTETHDKVIQSVVVFYRDLIQRDLNAYTAFYSEMREAERTADRKFWQGALKSGVAIVASVVAGQYYLGSVAKAGAVATNTGAAATANGVVTAMVAGGIQSGTYALVMGQNPLIAATKGAGFAYFNALAGKIVSGLDIKVDSVHHKALTTVANSILYTSVHGGNIARNMTAAVASSSAGHYAFGDSSIASLDTRVADVGLQVAVSSVIVGEDATQRVLLSCLTTGLSPMIQDSLPMYRATNVTRAANPLEQLDVNFLTSQPQAAPGVTQLFGGAAPNPNPVSNNFLGQQPGFVYTNPGSAPVPPSGPSVASNMAEANSSGFVPPLLPVSSREEVSTANQDFVTVGKPVFTQPTQANAFVESLIVPQSFTVVPVQQPVPVAEFKPVAVSNAVDRERNSAKQTQLVVRKHPEVKTAPESKSNTDYTNKKLLRIIKAATKGDMEAKREMTRRFPMFAAFLRSIDPNLERSTKDSTFMAEAKVYGRSAKDLRDGAVYFLNNPAEVITAPIVLGADVIEAALHYYAGMSYHQPSEQRNMARVGALVNLWNADGLTKRQAILTTGASALLFGGLNSRAMPVPRDFSRLTVAEYLGRPAPQRGRPILNSFEDKQYAQGNKANLAHNGGNAAKHSNVNPLTRKDLNENLLERGFKFHSETPRDYIEGIGGGTVTYKGPDGRTVTIKDTGEVIMVQKKWTADGLRKYPERQDYLGNRLSDQSHSTGHFVEPYIGPYKPKGPGL